MAAVDVGPELDATVLIAGQGALMDALARRLSSEGIELVRATRDEVAQVARVSAPDVVLLGGDAASDRSGHLLELLTSGAFASSQPVIVVGGVSLRALGGIALRSNVAGLVPEGGLEPCARRVRELLELLTTRGLEGRSLQQAVDAIARGPAKPIEIETAPGAESPPPAAKSEREAPQPRARRPTLVGLPPTAAIGSPPEAPSVPPRTAQATAPLGAVAQRAAALKAQGRQAAPAPQAAPALQATPAPQALGLGSERAPGSRVQTSRPLAGAAAISPFARTLAVDLAEPPPPAAGTQPALHAVGAPPQETLSGLPADLGHSRQEAPEIEVELSGSEAPEPLVAARAAPGTTATVAADASGDFDRIVVPRAKGVELLRELTQRALALRARILGSTERARRAVAERLRALGASKREVDAIQAGAAGDERPASQLARFHVAAAAWTGVLRSAMNRPRVLAAIAMLLVAGAGAFALAARGGHTEPSVATASLAVAAALSAPNTAHASEPAAPRWTPARVPAGSVHAVAPPRASAKQTVATEPDASANEDGGTGSKALRPDVQHKLARANALVDEGHLLLKRGHLGLAEAAYMKALGVWPDFPRALAGLTRVHLQRKDGSEALRWAKRLVAKEPKSGQNHLLLGDASALRGDMQGARAAWLQAVRYANGTARKRLKEQSGPTRVASRR